MSVKVMGLVWESDLPAAQKLVLLSYADHADHDGNNVFPSIGLIAWKTGYSERQIQRITRDLESRKILIKDELPGPGGVNRFKIDFSALPLRKRTAQRDDKMSPPINIEDDNMSPLQKSGGDKMSPGGCQDDTGGVSKCQDGGDMGVTQTVIDSSLTDPLTDHAGADAPAPALEKLPDFVKNKSAYAALQDFEKNQKNQRQQGLDVDVSGYPEDVREVILEICRLWGLRPPHKIPGKGGDYAAWIKESRWLLDAIGEIGFDVLASVRDDWLAAHHKGKPPFTIGRPGALLKVARAKAGELRKYYKAATTEPDPALIAAAEKASENWRNIYQKGASK
ncbi:helix-turn-helix domain-containing protein [candidate division KSB1 bacterium]|nr:helix-turn-helix domain-containing protein [candidate division KSB1 bacterium]